MASWIWLALALYVFSGVLVLVVFREQFQEGKYPILAGLFFPLWMGFVLVSVTVMAIVSVFRERR